MYFSITGTVCHIGDGVVVLENGGIGYNIYVSEQTLLNIKIDEELKLFTYLQVREDALVLFGFSSLQEKELFLQLISVSGIGCKLAQTILGGITPCELAVAIVRSDTKALCGVKGIGKKTAERIVLELKEKVELTDRELMPTETQKRSSVFSDAVTALQTLGYTRSLATDILSSVPEADKMSLNELIAAALKNAGKNRV